MGVLARRIVLQQRAPNPRAGALLSLLAIALFLMAKTVLGDFATNMYKTYPLDREILNFVYFSLIGLSVAMQIVGAALVLDALPPLGAAATRVIRWLAGGSFTLYLVHQPLLLLASALIEPVESRVAMAVAATMAVAGRLHPACGMRGVAQACLCRNAAREGAGDRVTKKNGAHRAPLASVPKNRKLTFPRRGRLRPAPRRFRGRGRQESALRAPPPTRPCSDAPPLPRNGRRSPRW